MKKWLPVWLKKPFWFLFKSPQRRGGLWKSWETDIRGLFFLISKNFSRNPRQLEPITICTGIKNRTENYLDFVLASVLKMKNGEMIELSVFDCGSQDAVYLENEIRKRWQGKLVFSKEEHPFERSYSFNKAISQSRNELVFAADADMSLPENLVELCNKYVSRGTVWFPVCFNLHENRPAVISPENGEWRYAGKGMFASFRWQFNSAGRYDEKYKTWGEEDWDLWLRFYNHGFFPVRNRCKGLFHHYHEPVIKPAK